MVISFSRSPNKTVFDYTINGRPLSRVSSVKDLGVIFDNDYSFSSHIEYIYNKAVRTFGFIKRTTVDLKHTSTIIYLSPHQQIYIDKLEGIQHKLLRYLALKSGHPMSPIDHIYDHLYTRFSIPYLRHVHYTHDAITAFKLVHSLLNSPETIDGFRSRNLPYNLRFPQPLSRPVTSSNYAFHSGSNRLLRVWNLLPPSVRSSSSLRSFKGEVSSLNLTELFSLQC